MTEKLLIATTNKGKLGEFKSFLSDLPLELVSLTDIGIDADYAEEGSTYAENSEGKARFYSELSGLPALSDDGGIEIDALNGAPGIHTKRWFGDDLSDEEMIREIKKVANRLPDNNRGAHFRTVITVVFPDGSFIQETGQVDGVIAREPLVKINKGYPYRSFFFLPEIGKYYHEADLSPVEEKLYNHRYKAVQKLKPQLLQRIVNRD